MKWLVFGWRGEFFQPPVVVPPGGAFTVPGQWLYSSPRGEIVNLRGELAHNPHSVAPKSRCSNLFPPCQEYYQGGFPWEVSNTAWDQWETLPVSGHKDQGAHFSPYSSSLVILTNKASISIFSCLFLCWLSLSLSLCFSVSVSLYIYIYIYI